MFEVLNHRLVKVGKLEYAVDNDGMLLKRRGFGYIRQFLDKDGYLKYSLTQEGRSLNIFVHSVVWFLTNGGVPSGYTIDHIDGDKLNNSIDNLQLLSATDNSIKGNARYWLVTDPEDRTYYVYNMESFVVGRHLHAGHLRATSRNQLKHKGWYCHECL